MAAWLYVTEVLKVLRDLSGGNHCGCMQIIVIEVQENVVYSRRKSETIEIYSKSRV